MESNSRSATDMGDQLQVIHLKEISVDFIKSNKFKNGAPVRWGPNIDVKTHTSATLTIQRALFKIRVAEVSVEFKPYRFGDDKVVRLEDSNHRVTVTFVYTKSKSPADVTRIIGSRAAFTNTVAPMDTQHLRRRIPEVQFRVLIIGRANAGKTSILKRICETTESPVIYRGKEEVKLDPSMDRGEHRIDDELVFSNHKGYVFHDSRGIESGNAEELMILQQFIRRKCEEKRLRDRLHAIWYCVPMDNQRPQLDLKFFKDVCPDRNVPVIAVFTKYDQFRRNVQIYVEDFGSPDDNVSDVAEKQFQEHYLLALDDDVRFVRLEQMHKQSMGCDELIETTAAALNDDSVALMLLFVQRSNLKLSVKRALKRTRSHYDLGVKQVVLECLISFLYLWVSEVSDCRGSRCFNPVDDPGLRLSRE
ncbi:hypothetical protein EDB89DRAFT_934640 [Lactarius sanguifluus]|nr:hypothetical protein EDB89DRAFT_934640 [Lactarius sanguifluus]